MINVIRLEFLTDVQYRFWALCGTFAENYKTTEYLRMKGVLNSIELRMLRRVDYMRGRNILGESHVQSYVTPAALMLG